MIFTEQCLRFIIFWVAEMPKKEKRLINSQEPGLCNSLNELFPRSPCDDGLQTSEETIRSNKKILSFSEVYSAREKKNLIKKRMCNAIAS